MKNQKRLLIPAALAVSACTPTPAPRPPCGSAAFDICMPDGGYYCGEDCAVARTDDGGVLFVDGMPECLC